MNKVHGLVASLMDGSVEHELEHTQTIKIPERSHQQLRALAQFVGRSKSALASKLLVAAIEDAIETLPDEKTQAFVVRGEAVSMREYVRSLADEFYQDLLDDLDLDGRPPLGATRM